MEELRFDAVAMPPRQATSRETNLALGGKSWAAFNVTNLPSTLAPFAVDEDTWSDADRALSAIRVRSGPGSPDSPKERAMLVRATAAVRDNLLEAAHAASEAARRARAVADALDRSLAVLANDQGERPTPLVPVSRRVDLNTEPLSEREREVLLHVAEGRSNKAIAAELFVSPNTVKTHVSALLRKLNATSRAQLATIAVHQGLC
jgi:DNA-binding CsgD family transcriptional regulator